ncbi:MAG: PKD domain-containing protein, partial [Emticicia sp.]|uniref:PKD domain-containing protein n=1 Tax=Emticicia sp. TaxID=1930953 RepID=UPI003BA6F169
MKGRIGNTLKTFLLIASFTYISFDSVAQFYVGGKLCIGSEAPTTPPMGSPPATNTDCSEPTIFFDENKNSTAWLWDFGDPTTTSDIATTRNPKYFYSTPGQYTVTLTRTIANVVQAPETRVITIGSPPEQPMFFGKPKGDTTICDGKRLRLDPYRLKATPPGATFLWFPKGQTTQTIDVDSSGCYSVEVFDPTGGCSRIAQINVKFCLQETSSGGGEKWYFGQGATLDFRADSGPPVPRDTLADNGDLFGDPEMNDPIFKPIDATASNPIRSPEGVAMVYGPSGSLVFYTDGAAIYGSNDQLLPAIPPLTDSNLGGTNTSTQSAVIIPKNTCNECPHHLYYVYTINKDTGLLSYSIVDTRRNNGRGAVVEKNIPVSIQTSQRITAIKNADETGFWIYSHDAGTNTFRILKIDATGTKEVTQNLGLVHDDADSQKGYMKLSPTGGKLAIAVSKGGKNFVEVFEINPQTGELEPTPLTIDLGVAAPPHVYGVEFSDDEEKLYVTLRGNPALNETSYLYQLNLNLRNPVEIASKKVEIDKSAILAYGALQRGPISGTGSKFIYMAIDGSRYIPYIQEPNQLAVQGQPNNAAVIGYQPITNNFGADVLGNSGFGFPNVIHAKQEQEGEGLSATYTG